MHFCLFWYLYHRHVNSFRKLLLDIRFWNKNDKTGIFDVVTSCSVLGLVLQELDANKKRQVSLVVKYMLCGYFHNVTLELNI